MSKQQAIKSLETIIGRLSNLNYRIDGNALQEAIREVAHARDKLQSGDIEMRKIKK